MNSASLKMNAFMMAVHFECGLLDRAELKMVLNARLQSNIFHLLLVQNHTDIFVK